MIFVQRSARFALAGGELEDLPADVDGYDIWDSISSNTDSPRNDLLVSYDTGGVENFAVRRGSFKLMHGSPPDVGIDPWYNSWYATAGGTMDDYMTLQKAMKESLSYAVLSRRTSFEERRDDWREAGKVRCKINKGMADSPRGMDYITYSVDQMRLASTDKGGRVCRAPDSEPCLFNLLDDPCELMEYTGADRARIIDELSQVAERYKDYIQPPQAPWSSRSLNFDPEASPDRHFGVWVPWITLTNASGSSRTTLS